MAWLTNWAKRIELTIDYTKVDAVLSNFPILVKISNSSGIDTTDITSVFTELGSDSNRKKIAVTTNDGTTQCYVEIERFDYANSVAWLWVKIPSIASGASTIFYLYYDSSQANNTTYVGDTTDTPAQSVWDSNFVGVWHMAQDPSGGADAIKNSTSAVNHGTSVGSMLTEDLVDGKVGKAIDFDGGDDYINCGSNSSLDNITNITIESTVKLSSWGETGYGRIIAKSNTGNTDGWQIFVTTPNGLAFTADYATTDATWYASTTMSLDTWAHVAVQHTRGSGAKVDGKIYVDGTSRTITGGTDGVGAVQSDAAEDLLIASRKDLNREFEGIIDEVRISNIHRTAAWIKATYYSNWDTLITYGTEEGIIVFTFSSPIPTDLSTTYGTTQQLYLTTTISGSAPSYTYDAAFYDAYDDSQISSTVYGTQSGQPAGVIISTPSGINYSWYVTAVSSGVEDTSSAYTFSNRFLYDGYVTQEDVPVDRVVRLYHRDTGELVDSTTSSGVGGYYYLGATFSGEHFIVAFDDAIGANYNALILDKLLPGGIG